MARWTGLEPATPCVTGRYSNQLNYHRKNNAFSFTLRWNLYSIRHVHSSTLLIP